jgi:hypothetical protein
MHTVSFTVMKWGTYLIELSSLTARSFPRPFQRSKQSRFVHHTPHCLIDQHCLPHAGMNIPNWVKS